MPRESLPEQTRMKAMRSRWFGSMLAWILKTKPVIFGSRRLDQALVGVLRARRRRECRQRVDEVAHAEIAQRAAEEDRRQMAFAKGLQIERLAGLLRERRSRRCQASRSSVGSSADDRGSSGPRPTGVLRRVSMRRTSIRGAGRRCPRKVRPWPIGQVIGRGVERQRLLDLVEEVERARAPRGPSC